MHICGLGAKVGCERPSEHSTCRDESHKYALVASMASSVVEYNELNQTSIFLRKNRV